MQLRRCDQSLKIRSECHVRIRILITSSIALRPPHCKAVTAVVSQFVYHLMSNGTFKALPLKLNKTDKLVTSNKCSFRCFFNYLQLVASFFVACRIPYVSPDMSRLGSIVVKNPTPLCNNFVQQSVHSPTILDPGPRGGGFY